MFVFLVQDKTKTKTKTKTKANTETKTKTKTKTKSASENMFALRTIDGISSVWRAKLASGQC